MISGIVSIFSLAVLATPVLNDYYIDEWEPRWEKSRAEDLVLYDGDPVIVGCIEDTSFPDREANRVFTMRAYDLSASPPDTIWTFMFDDDSDSADDDGYALVHYTDTGIMPNEDYFLGVGFTRVSLGSTPVSGHPAGLSILLDDNGCTGCSPHDFHGADWRDTCLSRER